MPASITINLDDAQLARLTPAVKDYLQLEHDPTLAEGKQMIVTWLKKIVWDYEQRLLVEALPLHDPFEPT